MMVAVLAVSRPRLCAKRQVMAFAALDFGSVRVGVAVSDESIALACPRPAFDARDRAALLECVRQFAQQEGVVRFIIGCPLNPRGEPGPAADRAIAFAQQVRQTTGVEVELYDERFTTTEAARRLQEAGTRGRRSRKRIDGAAACVLLQSWLDRRTAHAVQNAVPNAEPNAAPNAELNAAQKPVPAAGVDAVREASLGALAQPLGLWGRGNCRGRVR